MKQKLLLAGKLALAARLVTTAKAKEISARIEALEAALDAYDNEIVSGIKEEPHVSECEHPYHAVSRDKMTELAKCSKCGKEWY